MTDRPILFSAPMVRALLDGRKTQTRRVLKPQPDYRGPSGFMHDAEEWGWADENGEHVSVLEIVPNGFHIGGRLWVRETWRAWSEYDGMPPRAIPAAAAIQYPADNPLSPWDSKARPSIHMPRWASRLTLIVTDVRVQRLQDISEADAIAEGIAPTANSQTIDCDTPSPRDGFRDLWNGIHGPGAWDENPWVAAISFDVVRDNIDDIDAPK